VGAVPALVEVLDELQAQVVGGRPEGQRLVPGGVGLVEHAVAGPPDRANRGAGVACAITHDADMMVATRPHGVNAA
jgi:hypothetical protein